MLFRSTYANVKDAKDLVGQIVAISNDFKMIDLHPEVVKQLVLESVSEDSDYPFCTHKKDIPLIYQFIRKIISEKK